MDEKLRVYFDHVLYEMRVLRMEWRLYRSLFGTNEETVTLLNEVSGLTAQTLERVLFERCLLGIRRLTDKPISQRRQRESVSIKGLVKRIGQEDKELLTLVNQAEKSSSFARNWADRRIAHTDLDYKEGRATLETASRGKVEDALASIDAAIKWVGLNHLDKHAITKVLPPLDDERAFLRAIYLGAKVVRNERKARATLIEKRDWKTLDDTSWELDDIPRWLKRDDPPFDVD